MHLPGDILSQLMHPPRWHFVPLSQYESPYLGQSLRVSQAYLGYILGNFWAYLRHICKKTIVQLAFLGRQIVPSDKMSHFLPRDKLSHQTNCPTFSPETKCPKLCNDASESCWKIVGTFCQLSNFVNLKANTLGKGCAFRGHVLDISWLHSDYILATIWLHFLLHLGYISATFWLHSAYIPTNSDYILATFWLHAD